MLTGQILWGREFQWNVWIKGQESNGQGVILITFSVNENSRLSHLQVYMFLFFFKRGTFREFWSVCTCIHVATLAHLGYFFHMHLEAKLNVARFKAHSCFQHFCWFDYSKYLYVHTPILLISPWSVEYPCCYEHPSAHALIKLTLLQQHQVLLVSFNHLRKLNHLIITKIIPFGTWSDSYASDWVCPGWTTGFCCHMCLLVD